MLKYFFTVISQSDHIRNIKLKKPISTHDMIGIANTTKFQTDLALAYNSFGHYASYIQEVDYTTEIKCNLHKNDTVMIQVKDFDKSYAIIKAIFKHKGNDG